MYIPEHMEKMGLEDSIGYTADNGILTIVIDTNKEIGPSASGKTTLVASSGGNASIDVGNDRVLKLGLNLYY